MRPALRRHLCPHAFSRRACARHAVRPAQDVFAEVMPEYWDGAKGVVLVYDVTRIHTLEACGIKRRVEIDDAYQIQVVGDDVETAPSWDGDGSGAPVVAALARCKR